MKEFFVYFPVSRYYYMEISSGFIYPNMSFPFGLSFSFSKKHFRFNIAFIVDVDFDIRFLNCDHSGFGITIDTPWIQLLDLNFYDIRHEESK